MKLSDFVKHVILSRNYRSVRAASMDVRYDDGRPISHTTLIGIINGRENIDTVTLKALARWAGVPMRYLIDMIEEPESPMPYERLFSAMVSLHPSLGEAVADVVDAYRSGKLGYEELAHLSTVILSFLALYTESRKDSTST